MALAVDVEAAAFVPKTDTVERDATPCAVELPEFTTPPPLTTGTDGPTAGFVAGPEGELETAA